MFVKIQKLHLGKYAYVWMENTHIEENILSCVTSSFDSFDEGEIVISRMNINLFRPTWKTVFLILLSTAFKFESDF